VELRDLLLILLLLILSLLLFFGILFGERSIGYYQQLKADNRKLDRMVGQLKIRSTILHNRLVELKTLKDGNYTKKESQ